jgi:hypothetical protein
VTEVLPADQLEPRAEEWARMLSVLDGSPGHEGALEWWRTKITG